MEFRTVNESIQKFTYSSCSPCYCFIVTDIIISKCRIVHAALSEMITQISEERYLKMKMQRMGFIDKLSSIIIPAKNVNITCEAAQVPKALKMTSTTRWQVSTLPPTTAAVSDGSIKLPLGIFILTGAKQPWEQFHTNLP